MSENNVLVLKVDVDTLKGYLEGVPRMADVLQKRGVKAGFYFSFGPDNSGKAIFRIFRKGFITKMLRTKAPSTYGLKTMMYGTLLPAPLIVPPHQNVIQDIFKAGHECGLHAWDHVRWQDKLPRLTEAEIKADLQKAFDAFETALGVKPRAFAAPGWQLTPAALAALDSFNFDYVSNTRGRSPFVPKGFKTLEIPSTLPTMDEIYGADGIDDTNIVSRYISLLKPGLNVHTVHAEMEGGGKIKQFDDLIAQTLDKGYQILPPREVAINIKNAPEGGIVQGFLPGRAGALSLQK
ncbi:MAG: polysaccharide deacetylase family protein [Elusimicrobia bacterium]|nr:polysaccharide deacetylase family protein [Elusimicrobiota bacterium]